jgi:HK97 family phage major capsid protein/HK97 family phage prohead protease
MLNLTLKFQNYSPPILNKSENNINEFSGYASIYHKIDDHNDIIIKGAFHESIIDYTKIKLLWQHKHDCLIGKIISLEEDDCGLFIKGEIFDDLQYAKEAISLIKNQIIDGLSIGCVVQESEYDNKGVRIIKKAMLKEISIVTFPANDHARINKENLTSLNEEGNYMINNKLESNISYQRMSYKSNDLEKMNDFLKSSGISSIEIKSLNSFNDDSGSALIGRNLHDHIISNLETKSPLRSIGSVEQISGSYIDFVIENGEFSSGWVAEMSERSETNTSKLIQKRIQVHELYAQPKATSKLMEDSEINFNNWLIEQISDSFIKKENESFLHGDGDNKPKGILVNREVESISSEENNSISVQDILNLINSLDQRYLGNASFLMNRSTLSIIQNFKDNNERFIWQNQISTSMKETLFGIPVYCCSYMPKIENGKTPIILGDFKAGYKILDRKNVNITKDPYTDKPFIKFYAVKRVGGDVLDSRALKTLKV